MKVIIDCDVGVDDAYALLLASVLEDVEIVAITTIFGNSSLDNCTVNTKLLMDKLYKNKTQPPIYIGAINPIVHTYDHMPPYFSSDGLIGKADTLYKKAIDYYKQTFLPQLRNDSHAVSKIIELVNRYKNEITILAMGPLTNLALALRTVHDPESFVKNIRCLMIMGGNDPDIQPKFIEHNFLKDLIATKIVFEEYKCPIMVCTFEMTVRNFNSDVDFEELNNEFEKYKNVSERCAFMQSITMVRQPNNTFKDTISCDFVAALVALRYDECKPTSKKVENCVIETEIDGSKGLLKVCDNLNNSTKNIEIVQEVDRKVVKDYLFRCIKKLVEWDQEKN